MTQPPEYIDLLPSHPSEKSFITRVRDLNLSNNLLGKIVARDDTLEWDTHCDSKLSRNNRRLNASEESELATEVLILRHRFTEQIVANTLFKQAALTVIQNIYLFKNRKIFFSAESSSYEQQRQDALYLFSQPSITSIDFSHTFQHMIIARIWQRIFTQLPSSEQSNDTFTALHETVEKLNTLRNIYIILTTGLVRKLARNISDLYKQSVTYEDAVQIGSIGVARAAYRFHPKNGVRFSTYAANWVYSEIQRQALRGRLIRISTSSVEQYSLARRSGDSLKTRKYEEIIRNSSFELGNSEELYSQVESTLKTQDNQLHLIESEELRNKVLSTINTILPERTRDVIRRRYGLAPYQEAQSVIEISRVYGVTRSSIYQIESAAFKKLRTKLKSYYRNCTIESESLPMS